MYKLYLSAAWALGLRTSWLVLKVSAAGFF